MHSHLNSGTNSPPVVTPLTTGGSSWEFTTDSQEGTTNLPTTPNVNDSPTTREPRRSGSGSVPHNFDLAVE